MRSGKERIFENMMLIEKMKLRIDSLKVGIRNLEEMNEIIRKEMKENG